MRSIDVRKFCKAYLRDLSGDTVLVGRTLYHRPIRLIARGLCFDASSSGRYHVVPILFRQLLFVKCEFATLDGGISLRSESGATGRSLEPTLSDDAALALAQDVLTEGVRQLREWEDWNVVLSEIEAEASYADSPHPFEQLAYTRILLGRIDEAEEPLRTALTICQLTNMPKQWQKFQEDQIARLSEIYALLKDPDQCVQKLQDWAAYTKAKVGLAEYE